MAPHWKNQCQSLRNRDSGQDGADVNAQRKAHKLDGLGSLSPLVPLALQFGDAVELIVFFQRQVDPAPLGLLNEVRELGGRRFANQP